MPPSDPLAGLRADDLETLCYLALHLGCGASWDADWDESAASRRRYLAKVPDDLLQRFLRFLDAQSRIAVPRGHKARLAEIPEALASAVIANFLRDYDGEDGEDVSLAHLLDEDGSRLLLRWSRFERDAGRPRRAE